MSKFIVPLVLYTFVLSSWTLTALGQDVTAQDAAAETKIVTLTTQEDHRDMQSQLGISKLRSGPSGNPNDPNAANTDESKANPYPHLPEVLTLKNGEKVTTPATPTRLVPTQKTCVVTP